jgi:hypothetical protein
MNPVHFPLVDPAQKIADHLPIVRYMKISTFFMLARGKVFIPSLRTLQRTDPVEALLPWRIYPRHSGFHDALTEGEAFDWIQSKAQPWELAYIKKHEGGSGCLDKLVVIWLRELAIRRVIWCWYANRPESMAMWNNYGSHGIAIVSSITKIREALSLPNDALTSVSEVNYVSGDRTQIDQWLIKPRWIYRPYYFKQEAYQYEKEVRFVLASSDPVYLSWKGGVVRDVSPSLLLDEVVISPHIRFEEAKEMKGVILEICPFLKSHQVKISPLLFEGDIEVREKMYEQTRDIHPQFDIDLLGGCGQAEEDKGVVCRWPQMMFEV